MTEAFAWAFKIWPRLLVPSFPARSRRIQLPTDFTVLSLLQICRHEICVDRPDLLELFKSCLEQFYENRF